MIDLRRHTRDDLPQIRAVLLNVYAEVWADEIAIDPFMSVDQFDGRLTNQAGAVSWEVVVGWHGDEPVGYAYGGGVVAGGDARWFTVKPRPSGEFAREPGGRTFVLFELMVRQRWRKTGTAKALHDELLAARPESRVTLTVDPSHPKVQNLYETWGYECIGRKQPFPDSPNLAVMVRAVRQDRR